jgi:group I intron endonuclease
MNFDCGVYTITSPSGKHYVGSTNSFRVRWRYHRWLLRTGRHHCPGLQRAADKYGVDSLRFEKVAFVPVEELLAREQEQMDARGLANLYNANPEATGCTGRKLSEQHRARIAAAHLGKTGTPWTEEQRAKAIASMTGKTRTQEQCAAIGARFRGKPLSEEHKAKLRAAKLGRKLSDTHKAKIGAAGKGRKQSDETKQKISATKLAKRQT